MEEKLLVCPSLSYNKPQIICCQKEQCPFYHKVYGCIEAFNMFCNIEQWELEKKMMEKQELKAQGDINIY